MGVDVILASLYAGLAAGILVPLTPRHRGNVALGLAWVGTALYVIAAALTMVRVEESGPLTLYSGLVVHDAFSSFMLVIAGLAAVLALLSVEGQASEWPTHPAFYSLLPIILFGVYMMTGAANALFFLAVWLLVSVASYVVIALPGDAASRGAAVRYILMGAIATLFLAMWVAVHAVATGTVALAAPRSDVFDFSVYPRTGVGALALMLFLAAVGFKLGVVPFHWWLPNVYGRADGRAVSIVAGVAKVGFIAVAARLVYYAASPANAKALAAVLAGLAVITMTYGNIAALTTRDLQAILAYSSIAHIGYILTALAAAAYLKGVAGSSLALAALAAVAIHTLAYSLAKAPLFAALGGEWAPDLRGLRGIAKASPGLASGIALLLLSLLGVPPLVGFWGKLYMFMAAIKYSLPLVAIALINSGISAVYYVIAIRELSRPAEEVKLPPPSVRASIAAAALITLVVGVAAPYLVALIAP